MATLESKLAKSSEEVAVDLELEASGYSKTRPHDSSHVNSEVFFISD